MKRKLSELKKRAASDDWHEREAAGFALRDLLETDFDAAYTDTVPWVTDDNDRIRRAACLGCMIRPRHGTPAMIRRVLKRLDTLIRDDSTYVRKCSGPFVVGYLGYTYPGLVLPWIEKAARSKSRNARTNAAKAFTQALADRQPDAAIRILDILSEDRDRRVCAAVDAALRNLCKRRPDLRRHARRQLGGVYARAMKD